jgi:hypothetical protein
VRRGESEEAHTVHQVREIGQEHADVVGRWVDVTQYVTLGRTAQVTPKVTPGAGRAWHGQGMDDRARVHASRPRSGTVTKLVATCQPVIERIGSQCRE